MKLNVLIVDDEKYSRRFLHSMLSQHAEIKIMGELEDGDKVIEFTTRQNIDIMFLDIAMPVKNGLELAKQLRETTDAYIIFVTGHAEYAALAFDIDAVDYIMKPYDEERVGRALKRVKQKILEKQKIEMNQLSRRMQVLLTPREIEIMKLVSNGLQNKEIARKLGIKTRTVEFHVSNILLKLGVSSRLEAVISWKQIGT
jgi:DNA-binding NarL/FixJ family response regulator